jgi:hypothetical protein
VEAVWLASDSVDDEAARIKVEKATGHNRRVMQDYHFLKSPYATFRCVSCLYDWGAFPTTAPA